MKKLYVFFALIFVFASIIVLAQEAPENFLIKKEKNIDGKTDLYYLDSSRKEHYPAPKDLKGQYIEPASMEINSIEKLKQIELKIFKPEEIKYLGTNICIASFIVTTSGKIISVSFVFTGWEPKVPVTKLQEFASQIKESITFKCSFSPESAQEGYMKLLVRVFQSLNPPKKVRSTIEN